jgi:hypothetical protein
MPQAVDVAPDGQSEPLGRFSELDIVLTVAPVECEGRIVPAGSSGTIVYVSENSKYFEVEFDLPFHCVATVSIDQIAFR